MPETTPAPDRLRELLDAVLDEENATLEAMAGDAFASPFHFSRQLSRGAGEPPVSMRRRVLLERAAWQLRRGASVTDAAFAAGYDSVEGFSRAFARAYGQSPSTVTAHDPASHWLPAPNGIHFHPPMSLWVEGGGKPSGGEVTALLVEHDLDDTRDLLEAAKGLSGEEYRRPRLAGHRALPFDGAEESLAQVLGHLVLAKEVWLASIDGSGAPEPGSGDAADLIDRHAAVAPRWLAMVRDVERRGAWGDRLVDALCEPPETFVLGSVLAHVLTYAPHRRQVARWLLADLGSAPPWPEGDPITWLQRRTGGPA
ncbi:helix-turn-helix domain-containing protein [Nocardioides pantholopis]|uniref:helix-turn-helix domain-containing protein n=1 Tax=Nocardioides pantholopis TaxID=2483798 RepID=UPI000F08830E|nr:helix-turn-helix domain-containing protein [Nocardioides pantholopis]